MLEKIVNEAKMTGVLATDFVFSNESFGTKLYEATLESRRRNGTADKNLIVIPEYLLDDSFKKGQKVKLNGEYRSHNYTGKDGKIHSKLYVYVTHIHTSSDEDENFVYLDGYICKKGKLKETPRNYILVEAILAVNRKYDKADYIPCVFWYEDAKKVTQMEVGTHLHVMGRVQSRDYEKTYPNGQKEARTAYEISVEEFAKIN